MWNNNPGVAQGQYCEHKMLQSFDIPLAKPW